MEALPATPTDSFTSGVDMEERRLTWRIKHFPVVLQHDSMIDSQEMPFYAGESIGLTSKWCACLSATKVNGKSWAGIYIRLKERPALQSQFLYVQCQFKIKLKGELTFRKLDTKPKDIYAVEEIIGLGFSEFADRTGEVVPAEETAIVRITFKIYSPSPIPHSSSIKDSVEEFRSKSKAKARRELQLIKERKDLTHVKLVPQDKRGSNIKAKWEILSARSPVFKAMFESDMSEAHSGIIQIADIGYDALKVLIHYLYHGELLAEWKHPGILPELVNAAAKYQLPDLLEFLDGMMGKVCSLENVGVLIQLAGQLSLKRGQEELLRFVRMKGTSSIENFLQILGSHSDSDKNNIVPPSKAGPSKGHEGPSSSRNCSTK